MEQCDEPIVKNEENEPNTQIKCEFLEIHCNVENLAPSDTESIANSPAGSTDSSYTAPPNTTTTDDDARYFCDYCGKGYNHKSHLASHMTAHINKIERKQKTFTCSTDGCSQVLKTKKLLEQHRLNIHKIKPERRGSTAKRAKLCCPKCPKWFAVQYKLDGHIRSKHEGLKVF